MSNYTNFDLLLYAASEQYCEEWVENMQGMPALDGISKRERRRFYRMVRKSTPVMFKWTPLKIAVVAILLCMSISFTACMCIPSIRLAIKNVVVEWYREYISVVFCDGNETELPETETEEVLPDSIHNRAYIDDSTGMYTFEVKYDSTTLYCVDYFVNNQFVFTLTQGTTSENSAWLDSDDYTMEYVMIHQYSAVLIRNSNSSSLTLVWQDGVYEYGIEGVFDTEEDIIALAERVRLDGVDGQACIAESTAIQAVT